MVRRLLLLTLRELAAERQARFGVLAPAAPYIEGAWGAARAGEDALVGVVRAAFSCAGQALALALSVCRAGARFVGDAVTFAWGLAQAAAGVVIAALGFLADQALQVLAAAAAAAAVVDWPTVVVRAGLVLLVPSAMVLLAKRQRHREAEAEEEPMDAERFSAEFQLRPWATDGSAPSSSASRGEEPAPPEPAAPAKVDAAAEPAPAEPAPAKPALPPLEKADAGSEDTFVQDLDAWQAFMATVRRK